MSQVRTTVGASDPFAKLDAVAQAGLVRTGEVSAAELVEAAIARIEAANPSLNAVTHKLYDQARARAAAGVPAGPFAGVPFLIKDLLSVAGAPNTMGCRALVGNVAAESSAYAQAFEAAGLVTIGRTNTPEFGLIDTTEPALFGPTRNPWDRTRSPAGSSGGAGAAVAAGMTPMAHASDGGGSIRLPACHNGVFGLKPSRDRNLSSGVPTMPFGLPNLAVNHVLTRSVRDSALMLSVTEDPQTPLGAVGFVSDPLKSPLRIGLVREGLNGLRAAPDVDAAVLDAARLCEGLGHPVEPAAWPFSGPEMLAAFFDEWMVLGAAMVRMTCSATGCPPDEAHFEPWTLELARRGEALTPDRLAEVVKVLTAATRGLDGFFERYDILLSPVLRHPPKLLGEHATDLPFEVLFERVLDNVAYTPVANVAGAPAMSAPLAWSPDGLPIGVQFMARMGGEASLLGLAYQLEAAAPWAERWPTLAG